MENGDCITIHCPNTGAMTGCAEPGSEVWYSESDNTKRKYAFTWELTKYKEHFIGINTIRANKIVFESINVIAAQLDIADFSVSSEVSVERYNSRLDFCLKSTGGHCYIEVKSVTLLGQLGMGYFPDTKSDRALKHVETLIQLRAAGYRAVMLYCVQHSGIDFVLPATHIDPRYSEAVRTAKAQGVEFLAYKCDVNTQNITLGQPIAVQID